MVLFCYYGTFFPLPSFFMAQLSFTDCCPSLYHSRLFLLQLSFYHNPVFLLYNFLFYHSCLLLLPFSLAQLSFTTAVLFTTVFLPLSSFLLDRFTPVVFLLVVFLLPTFFLFTGCLFTADFFPFYWLSFYCRLFSFLLVVFYNSRPLYHQFFTAVVCSTEPFYYSCLFTSRPFTTDLSPFYYRCLLLPTFFSLPQLSFTSDRFLLDDRRLLLPSPSRPSSGLPLSSSDLLTLLFGVVLLPGP
jgi:hypothetical protein